MALLSAAAALLVGGRVSNLMDGVELAAQSIKSGAAQRALERLVAISNGRA